MNKATTLWERPDKKQMKNLNDAQILLNSSTLAIKIQLYIFFLLSAEMFLNIFVKLFQMDKQNLYFYGLICRTALVVNLVFIALYTYQAVYAKWLMYLETLEMRYKGVPIWRAVLFDLLPQIPAFLTRITSMRLYKWLFSEKSDEEKQKAVLEQTHSNVSFYLPSISPKSSYGTPNNARHHSREDTPYPGFGSMSTPYNSFCARPIDMFNMSPISKDDPPSMSHTDYSPVHVPQLLTQPAYANHGLRYSPVKIMPARPSWQFTQQQLNQHQFGHHETNAAHPGFTEVEPHVVWRSLGMDENLVDVYVQNLRKWIHTTIVSRVVEEINITNNRLKEMGNQEVVIGESSTHTLRRLMNKPGQHPPNLAVLVNFLDISKDQAYVVNRLRELEYGLSLSRFMWNGGSTSTQHPWHQHLPNDAALLLHLISTYIDSKHSQQDLTHFLTSFSQYLVVDSLDRIRIEAHSVTDPDFCALYQVAMQPPHFKVIVGNTIYDILAGRRNLFESLVIFFYKVTANQSSFKWLNTGKSCLNLNWIFENTQ